VIEVSHTEPESGNTRREAQKVEKHNGIHPTGNGHQDPVSFRQSSAQAEMI